MLTAVPSGQVWLADGDSRLFAIDGESVFPISVDDPCAPYGGKPRLESVVADQEFVRSRLVFLAWRCGPESSPTLAVVKYRELQGVLGNAAQVASFPLWGDDWPGRLAVTSNEVLYVSIPQPRGTDLYRLDFDGFTPRDNPQGLARIMTLHSIEGMAGLKNILFLVSPTGLGRLDPVRRGSVNSPYVVAENRAGRATSITVRTPDLVLVARRGAILEFRIAPGGPVAHTRTLSLVWDGRISGIAAASDGTLYAIESAPAGARLFRLMPTRLTVR